jgi:hyperosmotically inducible protein
MITFKSTRTLVAMLLSGMLALAAVSAGAADSLSAGEVVDDASIGTRLTAALIADDLTDAADIDIEINAGNVQLNGYTDSQQAIDKAGKIAEQTEGVKSVKNNLKVADGERSAEEYAEDKILVGKVNAALVSSQGANAARIDVEVNNGRVSLGGHVDSENAKSAAEQAAKSVSGVREVDNNLEVR